MNSKSIFFQGLCVISSLALAQGCMAPTSDAPAATGSGTVQVSPVTTGSGGLGLATAKSVPLVSYSDWTWVGGVFSGAPLPYPQFATVVGMTTSIVPTLAGYSVTNCTISPALPAGLSISATDCSITGTPSATSTPTLYLVSAYHGTDAGTALVALGVSPSGTQMIATSRSSYIVPEGQALSLPVILGGGASASSCINGAFPGGLSATNCSISTTPSSLGAGDVVYMDTASVPVFSGFQINPYFYGGSSASYSLSGYPASMTYVSFEVVNASTEPVVTYGGSQAFTQSSLSVGTPMKAITPTNSGATITGCAASPALPAGLSLSNTDCSISGTPSAASPATLYTLTPSHGSTAGNPLSVNLSVAPATVNAMGCQSGTLCVHDQMPLWDQSDPKLTTYVNGQTGLSLPGDPGWCGAVSGAMVLESYLKEIQKYTGLQSKATPSPYTAGMTEYPFIYNTMNLLGTDIAAGGTPMPNTGMSKFAGACMQTDLLDSPSWVASYSTLPWENPASYRQGMPLGWLGVCTQAGGLSSCHALAVNGVEGSYFKIYDPWGTVYDGTINVSFPAPAGNPWSVYGTVTFISGDTMDFVDTESSGVASLFAANWIFGYVYTQNGPAPTTTCANP